MIEVNKVNRTMSELTKANKIMSEVNKAYKIMPEVNVGNITMIEVSDRSVLQTLVFYLYSKDITHPKVKSLINEVNCSIFEEENASFEAFLSGEKTYTLTKNAYNELYKVVNDVWYRYTSIPGTYSKHIEFAKYYNQLNVHNLPKLTWVDALSILVNSNKGDEWYCLYSLDSIEARICLAGYLIRHQKYPNPSHFDELVLSSKLSLSIFKTVPVSIWATLPLNVLQACTVLDNPNAAEALGFRWEKLPPKVSHGTYGVWLEGAWLRGYLKSYPEVWSLYQTILDEPSKRADSYEKLLQLVENNLTLKAVVLNMFHKEYIKPFVLKNALWGVYINPIQEELDRCDINMPKFIDLYNFVISS